MRRNAALADVQIVVERRGRGSTAWCWRLVEDVPGTDLRPLGAGPRAYPSAQCAYEAARSSLRDLQEVAHGGR